MKAEFSPPSPIRLARKAVEVERLFGSRSAKSEPPPDPDSLLTVLREGGLDRLPRKEQRFLSGLIGWTRREKTSTEYKTLLRVLERDLAFLLPSVMGDLLPWMLDADTFYRAIGDRMQEMSKKQRALVLGPLFGAGLPLDPTMYADTILTHATQDPAVSLADWRHRGGVPAGSALERYCIRRLLSEPMAPWLASQTLGSLVQFLEEHRGTLNTVLLANALLVPLHGAGAAPKHLAPDADLTHAVGLFERALPPFGSAARQALAPEAVELLRWADLRARLERIFRQWRASDTYRPEYWRGWIRHISDVHEFPGMKAIAMRIRDHWFIEFGDSGNAAYAYSDRRWRAAQERVRSADRPADLRYLDSNLRERAIHTPSPTPWNSGWYSKFDSWVRELTHTSWGRDA